MLQRTVHGAEYGTKMIHHHIIAAWRGVVSATPCSRNPSDSRDVQSLRLTRFHHATFVVIVVIDIFGVA